MPAGGAADLTVRLWHVATGQELLTIDRRTRLTHLGPVQFSPDGRVLAVASGIPHEDGRVLALVRRWGGINIATSRGLRPRGAAATNDERRAMRAI